MVIDDEDVCRSILCEMLTDEGYDCRGSDGGRAALRQLRTWPADLIIVDMLMPDFDGVETIIAIRSGLPKACVIALSGGSLAMPPDYLLSLAKSLGAHATLTKPIHLSALVAAVEKVLKIPTAAAGTSRSRPYC